MARTLGAIIKRRRGGAAVDVSNNIEANHAEDNHAEDNHAEANNREGGRMRLKTELFQCPLSHNLMSASSAKYKVNAEQRMTQFLEYYFVNLQLIQAAAENRARQGKFQRKARSRRLVEKVMEMRERQKKQDAVIKKQQAKLEKLSKKLKK